MTTVELSPGASHAIELPGRGSAGYAWEFSVEGDAACIAVVPVHEPVPAPAARPSNVSHAAHFELRALRAGRARVLFQLRRPWESMPLADGKLDVDVEVRG